MLINQVLEMEVCHIFPFIYDMFWDFITHRIFSPHIFSGCLVSVYFKPCCQEVYTMSPGIVQQTLKLQISNQLGSYLSFVRLIDTFSLCVSPSVRSRGPEIGKNTAAR